jgi:hypothetical protein
VVAIVNKGSGAPRTGRERGSNTAPRSFWRRLLKAVHDHVKWESYAPEKYYMRGPGPASLRRAELRCSNRIEGKPE